MLVGTTSVEQSELYAAKLRERGVAEVLVLNARPGNTGKESEVVSQAGRLGAVTVATNMAGRGTDILLGGNPSLMAKLRVRDHLCNFHSVKGYMVKGSIRTDASAAVANAKRYRGLAESNT